MASDSYTIWYWTKGPGGGSGTGSGVPSGASGLLPEPPPLAPPPPAPKAVEPAKPPPVEQTFVNWGRVIPISMGMRRMSPQIIWLKAPVVIGVTATADFAVSWGYNADDNPSDTECTALYANGTRIWTIGNGASLPGKWSWKFYRGTESQGQDPTMVADKGANNTPAYRNQLYGVFKNFPLEKFGFKLPGISAEIAGSGGEAPRQDSWNPDDAHPEVVVETPFTITKGAGDSVANSGIRSRTYHRRGQYYLEFRVDHYDTTWRPRMIFEQWTGMGVGVSLASTSLTYPPGRTSGEPDGFGAMEPGVSPVFHGNFARWPAGFDLDTSPWGTGDVVGIHINMNEGYARGRIVSHGGAWSEPLYYAGPGYPHPSLIEIGDPLYVQGTVTIPTYAGVGSTADKITVNFGASPFLGAIPAGATAWNGDGGTEGLTGTLPLRDFISKIAIYSGLDPVLDLDFIDIDDIIHGGIITNDTDFRDFLSVLGRAFGFDFYEGDRVRIIRRVVQASYTVDKAIPPPDLLNDSDRAITTTRRKDESPNEIELNYIDVTQQFRWNLQKARRILFPVKTTESKRKDSFSIPIVTNANSALTMAGKAMYREAAQNVDHECKLTSRHLDIEPSDILTITAADTEYTVKVAQVSIEEDMRITIRAVNLLTDEDMAWDAEAGEPALPYAGNVAYMDATEGSDRFVATQFVSNLWAMEGEDSFVSVPFISTLAATDRPDAFAGLGSAPDPHFASVVFLSGFNGADAATAAVDEAKARAITFVGNAQLDTAQSKFGPSSLLLDGTGDYLTLADHADYTIGASQFTLEAWIRPTATTALTPIISHAGTSSQRSFYFYTNGLKLTLALSVGGSTVTTIAEPGSSIVTNTWQHVAAERDASNNLRLYVNGVMVHKVTYANVVFDSPGLLQIGALTFTPAYFTGWIDEVRFTKGVARYASDAGFAVPTTAFPRS